MNGCPEGELFDNLTKLAEALQVVRNHVGHPIRVISGYRSPAYNEKIGGASRSMHMQAKAADLKCSALTPKELHKVILTLIEEGKIPQGGVGLYETFVHYDIRGTKARWNS